MWCFTEHHHEADIFTGFGADAELDQRTSRVEPAALPDQGNKPVLLAPDRKKNNRKLNLHFFGRHLMDYLRVIFF